MTKTPTRELVHLGGVYLLEDGRGSAYMVLRRDGPLWRVLWLGQGVRGDLSTVQITACSRLLRRGSPVPAFPAN